jgi:hypothetical protein
VGTVGDPWFHDHVMLEIILGAQILSLIVTTIFAALLLWWPKWKEDAEIRAEIRERSKLALGLDVAKSVNVRALKVGPTPDAGD